MEVSQFFNPWEPPPSFASPPQDPALAQRISKLAEFAARNGPSFVEVVRTKQQNNPEYEFLRGGLGSDYYSWVLYCSLYNIPRDQQQPAGPQIPLASPANAAEQQPAVSHTLPPAVEEGFKQVLDGLTGSKESITTSQKWFMACVPYAAGMAAYMGAHVQSLQQYERQLHAIYLVNDILIKGLALRPPNAAPESDPVAAAFLPCLGQMLAATLRNAGSRSEAKEQLMKMLHFWEERGVFDREVVDGFEEAMLSGGRSSAGPAGVMVQEAQNVLGGQQPQQQRQQQGLNPAGPRPMVAASPWQASAAQPLQPWAGEGFMYQQPRQDFRPQQPPMQSVPWQGQQQELPPQAAWAGLPMQAAHPHVAGPGFPIGGEGPPFAPGGQHGYGPPQQPPFFPLGAPPPWGAHNGPQGPLRPGPFPQPGGSMMGVPGYPAAPMEFDLGPGGFPPGDTSDSSFPPLKPLGTGPSHPEPKPYDPMSFPPGLIPDLVRQKNRVEAPYSPISVLDIEQSPLPVPTEPDDYLRARLDRLHAELQDFRPGQTRAEVEDARRRRLGPSGMEDDDELRSRRHAGEGPSMQTGTGMNMDGSFARKPGEAKGGGLATAGLGFGSSADEPQEEEGPGSMKTPYEVYRTLRSSAYKDAMASSQKATQVKN